MLSKKKKYWKRNSLKSQYNWDRTRTKMNISNILRISQNKTGIAMPCKKKLGYKCSNKRQFYKESRIFGYHRKC